MAQKPVKIVITGVIISVEVKDGDAVEEDDVLCIQEAMKMHNPILAPMAGKVTELNVAPEQLVEPGHVVAVIEY